MKFVLIIPDIHQKTSYLKYALNSFYENHGKPDITIYLSDFFDSFKDNETITKETAIYLKEVLNSENNIVLSSNHDIAYQVPWNLSLNCPGFTKEKCKVINSILTQEDWSKIQPYCWTDNFLITHAGVHSSFIPYYPNSVDWKLDLFKYIERGFEIVKSGVPHELFLPGDRMGENRRGGITWQDWDTEFVIIDGLNQIVGHSSYSKPQFYIKENSLNYNLDTHLQHFGILKDGRLKFYDTRTGEIFV